MLYDNEIRRAFYDDRGKHRASYIFEWFRNRELRWCKTDSMYTDWGRGPEGATYGKTLSTLYRKELKYTGLAEFRKRGYTSSPEWYLAVWNLYPQIELLLKAALPKLLLECLACTHYLSEAVDPCINGPLAKKMLIDESRLKRLRSSNGGMDTLRWLQHEKKTGQQLPDAVIERLVGDQFIPAHFDFIRDKMSDLQVYNYLQKQMELYGVDARRIMTWWRDTLSMQSREGKDLNDPYFYRPARLKRRHDELVLKNAMADLKATAEKSKQKFPQVEPVLQEIRDIYSYTGDQYMVVVPEQILDIVMEGRALEHCVGTSERYMERIESRESYILFLRKAAAPDESYYTLEVEPDGTVRQKRTTGDDQLPDIEDATAFLKEWQKEITKRLTDTERNLAKKSKRLRLEGFEQMRKDHVRIHTGKLQGRLLVDVLMADLMENEEEKTA